MTDDKHKRIVYCDTCKLGHYTEMDNPHPTCTNCKITERDKRIAELEKENARLKETVAIDPYYARITAVEMERELKQEILEAERRGFEAARQAQVPLGIHFSDFYVHRTFNDWQREVNSKEGSVNHE